MNKENKYYYIKWPHSPVLIFVEYPNGKHQKIKEGEIWSDGPMMFNDKFPNTLKAYDDKICKEITYADIFLMML